MSIILSTKNNLLQIRKVDRVEIPTKTVDAEIKGADGTSVFFQADVVAPVTWSQQAINIVSSKYFSGQLGTDERESSVFDLVNRVAEKIADEGMKAGYFDKESRDNFADILHNLCIEQKMAFNSPVWFNIGVEGRRQQASACFINSVEDSMESILDLCKTEGMLFKGGSGAGVNMSTLRASTANLAGGGTASGPVSFMKGLDEFAGAIKSGGKTRRAAKMVLLDCDHPDIEEFIDCKLLEEQKAHALIDAGYDGGFAAKGGAYDSVSFQNANHSVRLTDDFMAHALGEDAYCAEAQLLAKAAQAAWVCGDPGVQFTDTINGMHTCPETGPINASNPCSEYVFLDDSACNLASLNLVKFYEDLQGFGDAIEATILAQEILVGFADYPTEKIRQNSLNYRPLGLGYANLGAMLMRMGLPYDSYKGREAAANITKLMGQTAYLTSFKIAEAKGPFMGAFKNREHIEEVMRKHGFPACIDQIEKGNLPRNAQVTVLAPTGTIGFMMDCDTTGVEPDIALVKYKTLVGGGHMPIVNNSVKPALQNRGYNDGQVLDIMRHIKETGTIEGSDLLPEHLPVFDCAFKPENGERFIHHMGHVRMMAAVQPFLSGAISKTVNLPESACVSDILEVYEEAWKTGVKAVAVYRDGCKRSQPLSTSSSPQESKTVESAPQEAHTVARKRLPVDRDSKTHKFDIAGQEGYLHVGMYEDGTPGELFLRVSKEGSTIGGLMDCFATAVSLCLQYGVPLDKLSEKFQNTRFEPSGFTGNDKIRSCTSLVDYVFKWITQSFAAPSDQLPITKDFKPAEKKPYALDAGAPPCLTCGNITVRNGSCYKCLTCGETSGCS